MVRTNSAGPPGQGQFQELTGGAFQLLHYRIEPEQNRISAAGIETRITPRTMEVLLALAGRAGEVMTRNQIFDEVWGDFIVGDEALTRCITDLRKAFHDRPVDSKFIRTVPKKGYSLIPLPQPIAAARRPSWSWWGNLLPSTWKKR